MKCKVPIDPLTGKFKKTVGKPQGMIEMCFASVESGKTLRSG